MSNLKIDKLLQHDKNYIGTFSKDNVPILKNNQSIIINSIKYTDKKVIYSDKNIVIKIVIKKMVIGLVIKKW